MHAIHRLLLAAVVMVLLAGATAMAADAVIPPGTVITHANWEQYKQFMPDGMQVLWEGKYHWKFPPDFQIVVGPEHHYAPPKVYTDNTKKYAGQVKIVDLPNGEHTISGYVAGLPFPNPSAPRKGYKILVDEWYRYVPYLICGPDYWNWLMDRFGNHAPLRLVLVYRRLSHISDYGMPITDPEAQGVDYSEYIMLTVPEQEKYVTNLTLYYVDPSKPEDLFLFIPALRRSLRLTAAARCAPFVGTDLVQDDPRSGFNGGIVRFDSKYLRDMQVLTLTTADRTVYGNFNNFYSQDIVWPKPIIGSWELRPVYVIDVRRIPSERAGYCYAKQIMYVDKETYNCLDKEMYDGKMHLWKYYRIDHIASPVPHEGMQFETGNFINGIYDFQNSHLTVTTTSNPQGLWDQNNEDCRNYNGVNYDDVRKYSSVAGLSQVMR